MWETHLLTGYRVWLSSGASHSCEKTQPPALPCPVLRHNRGCLKSTSLPSPFRWLKNSGVTKGEQPQRDWHQRAVCRSQQPYGCSRDTEDPPSCPNPILTHFQNTLSCGQRIICDPSRAVREPHFWFRSDSVWSHSAVGRSLRRSACGWGCTILTPSAVTPEPSALLPPRRRWGETHPDYF